MRNSTWVLAVIAAATVSTRAVGQATAPPPQIVVSGEGEVHVSPDRAMLSLGVQTRAATAAAAGAQNAKIQSAILDTLRALGIPKEQISTAEYNIYPQMTGGGPQSPPRVTGYSVSNTVRVDIRRIADIGRVIDAALAKGANEMSGLQFYSSKADSARRLALAAAVEDARKDAEVLARAAGGSLGMLLEVSSGQAPIRPVPIAAFRSMAADKATPIEPGQQTISVSVTTRWTLVGGK